MKSGWSKELDSSLLDRELKMRELIQKDGGKVRKYK